MKRIVCLLLILMLCVGCAPSTPSTPSAPTPPVQAPVQAEKMRVHMLDVGQGDATFVELPGGTTMLIDAGEREYGAQVAAYIKALGYERVDILIGSHPHSDHIGGLREIVERFDIGAVWLPKKASTTYTFEKLLKAIQGKGLTVQSALAGKTVLSDSDLAVTLLSPQQKDYGDEMNLYSAVVKITYGENRVLIMGDAETENETEMKDVAADLIRVGHHGSKTSSGKEFVRRVGARIAVVSVGEGNSYGLPKDEILERWQQSGATVYRTDKAGTVIAECDGKSISVTASKGAMEANGVSEPEQKGPAFVLNTSSKKIHRPDCGSVATMREKNKEQTNRSAEELLQEGYTPCGSCEPMEGA